MTDNEIIQDYSPAEEKVNVISHGIGCILSVFALVFLVIRAVQYGNVWHMVSFPIFGVSLIVLFAASTLYHNAKTPKKRSRLKVFDHASIYVLIAGSYTPFTLVTLNGSLGWTIFGVIWGMALSGIILKLFFAKRFKIVSTIMYVLMGWVVVFAIKPIINGLPYEGFLWLLWGGIAYTIGAVFYVIKKIKFNHAIFHVLVLVGSFCQFLSIYYYVLVVK